MKYIKTIMLKKNKGFTLIELLVMIAIIGIISSIVLASLNSDRYSDANYRVHFGNGITHYVESYTKEDAGKCVYLAEKETRFCGEWSVEKIIKDDE